MGNSQHSYAVEASRCRRQAARYDGRPEKPFLLRLAEEFDHLEREPVKIRGSKHLS